MPLIVPTITTDSPEVFQRNLTEFQKFSKRIQVDASDGSFAPTSMLSLDQMTFPEGATIDLHVMSARPSDHLAKIIELKPSLCIIHAEVSDDIIGLFNQFRSAGIKTGLALLKTTFPGKVQQAITEADHVMIFAGALGQQGGNIDMMQIEKVPLIRTIKPTAEIGWDGGINLTNIRALAHADIDVLNVGSAITDASDSSAMYQSLIAESEKKGVLV